MSTPFKDAVLATAGLVGSWGLSEAAGELVDPKNGLNATTVGAPGRAEPSLLPNGEGSSMHFSSGNYCQVAHNALLNLADTWTMEGFIKLDPGAASSIENIMSKGGGAYYLRLINEAGGYRLQSLRSQLAALARSTVLSPAAGLYVVATKEGEKRRLEINAVDLTELQTNSVCANTATPLVFGQSDAGFAGVFEGWLQYLAVYNVAISPATVKAHYAAASETTTPVVVRPTQPPIISTELAMSVLNPDGSVRTRWGPDEHAVANVPRGLTFSTSDPGGFKDLQVGLDRDFYQRWPDLGLLRSLEVYGLRDGRTAWEGRTQEIPGHAGDEISMNPGAVGHSARLEDDPSFAEIYIDSDLSGWGNSSAERRAKVIAGGALPVGESQAAYADAGTIKGPGILHNIPRLATAEAKPWNYVESVYYGGGVPIGTLRYNWTVIAGIVANVLWDNQALLSTDDIASATDPGTDYNGTSAVNQTLSATDSLKKYAFIVDLFRGTFTGDSSWMAVWEYLKVIGRHGLTEQGNWPDIGFYGSDVIADIVGRAAPDLQFTIGSGGTIQPSNFPIPHLVFKEGVKASDAILGVNAFHQRSWGVYEGKTFFWRPPTSYRKRWQIRRSLGHQVELLGPQADDAINGVVVTFTDPGGVTRVVGPPGCATAYATSAALADTSPGNPVNEAGIERKWAELKLQFVTTTTGALEVGAAYLNEKLNSAASRGSVSVTGLVEDEAGGLYPAWAMRAGDAAVVVDGDGLERGIIETTYDNDSRTLSAHFDTTPHKVEAMMERMGIVLEGLVE